jgi:hypothetical protein
VENEDYEEDYEEDDEDEDVEEQKNIDENNENLIIVRQKYFIILLFLN